MITPSQLRSAARFGTPLRKETLLELAEFLEQQRRCDLPRNHRMTRWVLVAETDTHKTHMRHCKICEFSQYNQRRKVEVG